MKKLQDKYLVGQKTYNYDYQSTRLYYVEVVNFTDEEFIENTKEILHFSCFLSYVMNLDNEDTISDDGIIHELIHLLCPGTKKFVDLDKVRKKFNNLFVSLPKKLDIKSEHNEKIR